MTKVWTEEVQFYLHKARSVTGVNGEFQMQQQLYAKFANAYDVIYADNKSCPQQIAKKLDSLFPNNKGNKILDYGCSTKLLLFFP